MEEKRVADYFIISGVSENVTQNTETKPLINSVLPITDITVIFKSLGEQCPIGYTCIEFTPGGHIADLNNGNFKSPNIHICYKRGDDKPPLTEVGVYHQDRDRLLPDIEVVYETPYGRNASTGNTSPKNGTFITYRRAKTRCPYNQLVVVDLCVILNNKSEYPPHAFYSIKKNLNKSYYGMIGSEVFLCYKKTLLSPPSICYTPQIISRFPLKDLANFPLPDTVPLFCLPAGASIESRPACSPLPKPVISTFVLTSDSAQKIYGSALSFYELYDSNLLNPEQKARLSINDSDKELSEDGGQLETFAIKSICLLSRWPFFDCFERFLLFLHRLVFNIYPSSNPGSPVHRSQIPLEHHISHFLLDVSFPTSQRPSVMVQLMPGTDETITISQPSSRIPLPLTGASFIHLLTTLGVEHTMNVLLFGLCEQKILLHSLNPWLLTTVAEAITAILFPFHWQCPYVPLCPLSLHGILNAPLPFIVGIDSRCFDSFTPPDDVICVDLDTKSIFLTELKRCLNIRILPKRASRVLRDSLEEIFQKWLRVNQAIGSNQSPQHRNAAMEASRQQLKRRFDLEIQEAFIRFMATILRGFRSYLLPITRAPTVGATDPTSLFDFEGFLMSRERSHSQFYHLITKTQLFTHYIEERSFVSDKDTSLAFFDDCEERLTIAEDTFSSKPIKLFEKDDETIKTDRSVYIPAPEQSPSVCHKNSSSYNDSIQSQTRKLKFGPLNPALFHRHPSSNSFLPICDAIHVAKTHDHQSSMFDDTSKGSKNSFSISRRTKQEVEASRRVARKSSQSPQEWSKYLVSCCYCLWYSMLPSYTSYCRDFKSATESKEGIEDGDIGGDEKELEVERYKSIARILRHAYSTIVRMQRFQLITDEVCFRILTLLCGHYGQPALAVRVFFEMRKSGIKPNAVTYGYYNTALLESRWPDHSGKPTTVLWTKIRNVIMGVALFKFHGRIRMRRRDQCVVPVMGVDMNLANISVLGRAPSTTISEEDLFKPTTISMSKVACNDLMDEHFRGFNQHRRSLVNRSLSTYQKSTTDIAQKSSSIELKDPNLPSRRAAIRKSHSMHARSGSPERSQISRSSSFGDEDALTNAGQVILPSKKTDTSLIFTTEGLENFYRDSKTNNGQNDSFLIDSSLNYQSSRKGSATTDNLIQLSQNIDSENAQSNQADVINFIQTDDVSSEGTRSNRFSESITDNSTGNPSHDNDFTSLEALSTPNFKLSSLINDASNLQWSKWTSSQNPKSVYKGIKSVATGLVSSLQEIKSSFSMSESATPSKLITSVQHKSTNTREMLSQWATQWGYFLSQTGVKDRDESDEGSIGSEELLHPDGNNVDETSVETNDFQFYHRQLIESERQYNMSSCKDFLNHLGEIIESEKEHIAIVVKLTTCGRCTTCHSKLNDDEIMGRWSYNESNLNTKCVYCGAKIVPLMTVSIEDRREYLNSNIESVINDIMIDMNLADGGSKPKTEQENLIDIGEPNDLCQKKVGETSFTIPYLSPIVLRKELESVFESAGDNCPASCRFIDEHPIIFWNLLWYFSRIGVPTHLAMLCLTAKSISKGRKVIEGIKQKDKVVVDILWDTE